MSKIKDALAIAQDIRERHDSAKDIDRPVRFGIKFDRRRLYKAGLSAPEAQLQSMVDQFRLIKGPMLANASDKAAGQGSNANLIMITGVLPGDGATFTCANLALSMAIEKETSILLVDADVTNPRITRVLGLDKKPGLVDLLKNESLHIDDVTLQTNLPTLQVLPAGQPDDFATDLLAGQRMADVVTELSQVFPNHMVIFDSPALLVSSEARKMAEVMGQIALIVCANRTPESVVREALKILDNLQEDRSISLIVNRAGTGLGSSVLDQIHSEPGDDGLSNQ